MGAGYRDVLSRHNELLRDVWAKHGGHEVSTIGDAFFVVFADSAPAIRAAVDAQCALEQAAWPGRVRIGLHTGYARPVGGDYTALVVNQAARVVDAARGGQVLMTATAAGGADAGTVLPLGHYRVRDFDEPVKLYAAVADGHAEGRRPAPRAAGRRQQPGPPTKPPRRAQRRSGAPCRAPSARAGDHASRAGRCRQDAARR